MMDIAGFDWDEGNHAKCQKHGVPIEEIEAVFRAGPMVRPDLAHSQTETRFLAIGRGKEGRFIFLVFTIRDRDDSPFIRPISARYMHQEEIDHYVRQNPGV